MTNLESSLRKTLEEYPDDWPMRLLIVDKALERDAKEEAVQLLLDAPLPPTTEGELQRLVEITEEAGIELVSQFVLKYPRSVYGHQLLGTILEWVGRLEESTEHFAAARALGAAPPDLQPIHGGGGLNIPVVAVDDEAGEATAVPEEEEPVHEIEESIIPPPQTDSSSKKQAAAAPSAMAPPSFSKDDSEPREFERFTLEDLAPVEPSKQGGKKATAVMAAMIFHLVLFLIAALVVILPPMKDDPEIIAAIAPAVPKKQEMQKKNVVKQTRKTSASAAARAPLAKLMRANAVAKIALPDVNKTSKGPLGIGDADFGGGGFGSGTGGMGSGASFFGGSSTGQRFLFVLDHSISMKPHQVKLRNDELEKALKGLQGVSYHVMLFAGGVYYVDEGWRAAKQQPTPHPTVFESPNGEYRFKSNGLFDFQLLGGEGKFPSPKWLTANPSNVRRSIDQVKKAPQFGGTDWDTALQIAHLMNPPPDVIFFMTDGIDNQINVAEIIRNSRRRGGPKINCIAMQTAAAQKEFAEIAQGTSGDYIIVDKNGKPINGLDYIKNPSRFKGRL